MHFRTAEIITNYHGLMAQVLKTTTGFRIVKRRCGPIPIYWQLL